MGTNHRTPTMAHRYRKGSITYHVMDKPTSGTLQIEERPLAGVHSVIVEDNTTVRIKKTSMQANAVKMRCKSESESYMKVKCAEEQDKSTLSIGIMQPVFQISS